MTTPARVLNVFPKALSFDGIDDYVAIPDPNGAFVTPNINALSVFAWIYTKSTTTWQCIVERGSPTSIGWYFYVYNGNTIYTNLGGEALYSPPNVISINKWFFVGFVWNGSSVALYVNAVKTAEKSLSSLYTAGDRIYIGIREGGGANLYGFNGYISAVYIYRRALSSSEIYQLYAHPLRPPLNGLAVWLKGFPEFLHSGRWWDASGFNNHGTIYGAVVVDT